MNNIRVHPVNEYELSVDMPAHEGNGDEVFSERLSGGLRYFKQLRNGAPLASRFEEAGRTAEGGGITRP